MTNETLQTVIIYGTVPISDATLDDILAQLVTYLGAAQHAAETGAYASGDIGDSILGRVVGAGGTPQSLTDGRYASPALSSEGATFIAGVPVSNDSASAVPLHFYNRSTNNSVRAIGVIPYGLRDTATADRLRTPTTFKNFSDAAIGAGEVAIWTPAAGKKFRLMGYVVTQGVATGLVTLRDNTAGTTILTIPPHTIGVALAGPNMGNGILSAAANNVLTAQGVATETLSGYVFGTEE